METEFGKFKLTLNGEKIEISHKLAHVTLVEEVNINDLDKILNFIYQVKSIKYTPETKDMRIPGVSC